MFRTLTFSLLFLLHPVHVSITNIDYFPEMRAFRVFIRMYFDDFLLDSKSGTIDKNIINFSNLNASSGEVVNLYLRDNLTISVDKEQLIPKLKDVKLSDNEINLYLDYPTGKEPDVVTVKNTILSRLYGDQSNMIILKINGFAEGFKLTPEMTEHTFHIK